MAKKKKKFKAVQENVEERELKEWTDKPKSGFNTPFSNLEIVVTDKVQPTSKLPHIRKRA
jgi:hypothetical protein